VARGPRQLYELRRELALSSSRTVRRLAAALPASFAGGRADARTSSGPASPGAEPEALLAYAGAIGRNLFTIAAVLLLGYCWTLEGHRRVRELLLFAPLDRRRALRAFLDEVEAKVGAYLRGQVLVCAVIGLLALAVFSALRLPHAPTLGLVYAVGEAVPVLGPVVGTAVAALVALSVGKTMVLWVLAAAAALQLVESYLLVPRVMDRTVGISPLVTLLAISAFGSVLGLAGAILAIPLAAVAQLLCDRLLLGARARAQPWAGGRDRASAVRYAVQGVALDVRKRARGGRRGGGAAGSERVEDAVEGIAVDLDRMLAASASSAASPAGSERTP
jgi:predicted PurR-regulated permease PerM